MTSLADFLASHAIDPRSFALGIMLGALVVILSVLAGLLRGAS